MSKKYFLIKKEGTHLPKLKRLRENYYIGEGNKQTEYPALLLAEELLFSSDASQIVKLYMDRPVALRAVKNQVDNTQHMYFSTEVPLIDALADQTVYDKSGLYIRDFVLDSDVIYGHPLFKVKHYNAYYYFMRLDLVESLLRRSTTGFHIEPVEVV